MQFAHICVGTHVLYTDTCFFCLFFRLTFAWLAFSVILFPSKEKMCQFSLLSVALKMSFLP